MKHQQGYESGTWDHKEMDNLTTFRIDKSKYDRYGKQFGPVERMITLGVLVEDTRLQAIADAWRQEKETGVSDPEITDLLDALVEGEPE